MSKKINSCFLVIFIFSVIFTGCDKDNIIYGPSVEVTRFNIAAYEYSDNHYLVDTLYKRSFLEVYNDSSGAYSGYVYEHGILQNDISFEVWVQCEVTEINKRFAAGHIMLYEKPAGGYHDSLKNPQLTIGETFFGFFRKLNESEYFINGHAGNIGLKLNLPDNYHAGIVYKTNIGKEFGLGSIEVGPLDTLILKMFKTANQSPDETSLAWELKLKNIYRLPVTNVLQSPFLLDVVIDDYGVIRSKIPGMSILLLQITKLDRFTGTAMGIPDGVFDFLPNRTIITETGDIIFPTFRPFYDEFRDAGVDSIYWFPELYEQRKTVAQNLPIANKFRIYGYAVSGD